MCSGLMNTGCIFFRLVCLDCISWTAAGAFWSDYQSEKWLSLIPFQILWKWASCLTSHTLDGCFISADSCCVFSTCIWQRTSTRTSGSPTENFSPKSLWFHSSSAFVIRPFLWLRIHFFTLCSIVYLSASYHHTVWSNGERITQNMFDWGIKDKQTSRKTQT